MNAAVRSPTHDYLWGWETSSNHWNDNVVTGDGQDWKDIGAPPRPRIDFEDLVPATVYPVPVTFTSAGVPITTGPFQWGNGNWTSDGHATVVNLGRAGGSGNELNLNNVNLDFGFWLPMLGLSACLFPRLNNALLDQCIQSDARHRLRLAGERCHLS